jgi:hypothetical protein
MRRRDQSSQRQRLAAVPQPEFEAALAAPIKPTTNGIINAVFPPKVKAVSERSALAMGAPRRIAPVTHGARRETVRSVPKLAILATFAARAT